MANPYTKNEREMDAQIYLQTIRCFSRYDEMQAQYVLHVNVTNCQKVIAAGCILKLAMKQFTWIKKKTIHVK